MWKINKEKLNHKGFTLFEMIIVIALIATLSGVVMVVSLQNSQKKSRDSRRKINVGQIQQALETFRNDNGYYPSATSLLVTSYLKALPKDPKDSTDYTYTPSSCSGGTPNKCRGYELKTTKIESETSTTYSVTNL